MAAPRRRALVVVFGDVGHAPRMQNHVRELLALGYDVDFMGYAESELPRDLGAHGRRLRRWTLPSLSRAAAGRSLPAALRAVLRPLLVLCTVARLVLRAALQTAWALWLGLFCVGRPSVIVVQTPPVLPTLFVAPLLARWHACRYLVDWHNLGYTILAQKYALSPAGRDGGALGALAVSLAKAAELALAQFGHCHLAVTCAMRDWLAINGGVEAHVLYDRPVAGRFQRLAPAERAAFRRTLRTRLGWDAEEAAVPVVVTSTSWTADEDFDLLLVALVALDAIIDAGALSRVQLLITGKGPLREQYEGRLVDLQLRHVQFATLWLTPDDYCRLLGSADYGICLHASSSGVDLPMKAIDMVGAGLPLAALSFAALHELTGSCGGGLVSVFESPQELVSLIVDRLTGQADRDGRGERRRTRTDESISTASSDSFSHIGRGARGEAGCDVDWHVHWINVVAPLLQAADDSDEDAKEEADGGIGALLASGAAREE